MNEGEKIKLTPVEDINVTKKKMIIRFGSTQLKRKAAIKLKSQNHGYLHRLRNGLSYSTVISDHAG